MNKSDSIKELATALSKMQSELHGAKKDSTNPFFKSNYADLESVWDAIRAPLTKNGLSISQTADETDNGILLTTILMHSSGEWLSGAIRMVPERPGPQALGSCISYARRYALAAICGVVQVDDDGQSSTNLTPMASPVNHSSLHNTQSTAPAVGVNPNPNLVTMPQLKRLYAIMTECQWTLDQVHEIGKMMWGYESLRSMTKSQYDQLVGFVKGSNFETCRNNLSKQ